MIKLTCPSCGKRLHLTTVGEGSRLRCPACRAVMIYRAGQLELQETAPTQPPGPSAPPPIAGPPYVPSSVARIPRQSRMIMGVFAILLVLGAFGLIIAVAYRTRKTEQVQKQTQAQLQQSRQQRRTGRSLPGRRNRQTKPREVKMSLPKHDPKLPISGVAEEIRGPELNPNIGYVTGFVANNYDHALEWIRIKVLLFKGQDKQDPENYIASDAGVGIVKLVPAGREVRFEAVWKRTPRDAVKAFEVYAEPGKPIAAATRTLVVYQGPFIRADEDDVNATSGTISGRIRNDSGVPLRHIRIAADLMGRSGRLLGTYLAELPAGRVLGHKETEQFVVPWSTEDFYFFDIVKVQVRALGEVVE